MQNPASLTPAELFAPSLTCEDCDKPISVVSGRTDSQGAHRCGPCHAVATLGDDLGSVLDGIGVPA